MKAAKPAGVICSGEASSEPVAGELARPSLPGASPAAIAACSLAMMSAGVLAGATTPTKLRARKPLTPCSSNVGMSGASFERLGAGDADDERLPALVQLQRGRQLGHGAVDVAGDDVRQQRAAALVGHVRDVGAGRLLEALDRHVGGAADAAGGERDRARLGERDQLGQIDFTPSLLLDERHVRRVARSSPRPRNRSSGS